MNFEVFHSSFNIHDSSFIIDFRAAAAQSVHRPAVALGSRIARRVARRRPGAGVRAGEVGARTAVAAGAPDVRHRAGTRVGRHPAYARAAADLALRAACRHRVDARAHRGSRAAGRRLVLPPSWARQPAPRASREGDRAHVGRRPPAHATGTRRATRMEGDAAGTAYRAGSFSVSSSNQFCTTTMLSGFTPAGESASLIIRKRRPSRDTS